MTATPIYRARSFANALLLSAALALSACGGEGAFAWKPETPAEKQLRESRENLQRTVGEGGVAGAVGGAVIGGLLGGVGGAFQGAEIGRFAGAASGAYVRNLQAEFASKEEILDQVITDLEVTNTRLEETIAAMRGVVAETRAAATPDPTRVQRNLEEAQAAVRAAEGDRKSVV